MTKDSDKITLDDLGSGLYGTHLDRKNHRICKVLRVLMLRKDFIPFLEKLEKEALEEETYDVNGKNIKLWQIKFGVSGKLINNYLNKVSKSTYFKKQTDDWKDNFHNIAQTIITQSYLDGYVNQKNKGGIFSNLVFFDDSVNYPNIHENVYDKELFWKVFNDAFYSKKTKEKYGKDPSCIVIGGNKFDDIPNKEKFKPTDPKVCQIVFDDNTEKQELIDYIDKNWDSIENSLKAWRPSREEKRLTSSANFIRDVDIYNKYQEFKYEGYKNPDVKTYSWLNTDSEYKKNKEPNTIRKIVSLLKSEVKDINSEK